MRSYPVDISAPLSLAIQVTRADQVGNDALRRALGDVQQGGHVSDAYPWIAGDEQEQIAVVGEESEVRDDAQCVGRSLLSVLLTSYKVYPKKITRCLNRVFNSLDNKSGNFKHDK